MCFLRTTPILLCAFSGAKASSESSDKAEGKTSQPMLAETLAKAEADCHEIPRGEERQGDKIHVFQRYKDHTKGAASYSFCYEKDGKLAGKLLLEVDFGSKREIPWQRAATNAGQIYYWNPQTNETSWDPRHNIVTIPSFMKSNSIKVEEECRGLGISSKLQAISMLMPYEECVDGKFQTAKLHALEHHLAHYSSGFRADCKGENATDQWEEWCNFFFCEEGETFSERSGDLKYATREEIDDLEKHINKAMEAAKSYNSERPYDAKKTLITFLQESHNANNAPANMYDFSFDMKMTDPEKFWKQKQYRYSQGARTLRCPHRGNCEVIFHDKIEAGESIDHEFHPFKDNLYKA